MGDRPHKVSWVARHNPRKYKALLHFVANGGGPGTLGALSVVSRLAQRVAAAGR